MSNDAGTTRLLGLLDRILQVLVPPVRNRVSYVSFPDYTDNAFHVFRHALMTRGGLEHVWLLRDLSLRPRIEREFAQAVRAAGTVGNVLRVAERRSLRGYLLFLRSRFVFHTHGAYAFRSWAWRRQVVCLWHGMPIKCIGRLARTWTERPPFGTHHIATSAFFRDIIARAFAVPPHAVVLCGLPRCDPLRRDAAGQAPAAQVRERLGVAPGQRLVLWLPTYRASDRAHAVAGRSFLDDLPAHALSALEQAATRANAVVVAKLHPLDTLNDRPPQWHGAGLRLLPAQEWEGLGIQLYDLVAASDALISDLSSVLIDYLVTGRPMGILGFDPKTYARGLAFPFETLLAAGRYEVLDRPESFERFLRRSDVAPAGGTILHDDFEVPGSEQVLREAGL
jgi:CDP-glycerol glycerophosphotransferase (TagB/SpsB family)